MLLGFVWTWLSFFHHSKSPRNGMTSSSGQVSGQVPRPIYNILRLILFYRKPSALWYVLVHLFLYLMYALLWGKMLGGLNPSTDLLVGSTSQYGPVLTEVPSQLKIKQTNPHDMPAIPLSDQEEETHTLMQDSANVPSVRVGSNTIANQIPGWVIRSFPLRAYQARMYTRTRELSFYKFSNMLQKEILLSRFDVIFASVSI